MQQACDQADDLAEAFDGRIIAFTLIDERGEAAGVELLHAALQAGEHLRIRPQCLVRNDGDLHLAAAGFFHLLRGSEPKQQISQ